MSKKNKNSKNKNSKKKSKQESSLKGSISNGKTKKITVALDETTSMSGILNGMKSNRTTIVAGNSIQKIGVNLFGLPYQFNDAVDPRYPSINKNVGHNFTDNFLLEAPVCTFIPGKPRYLPGDKDAGSKIGSSNILIQAASGNLAPLQQLLADNELDYMRLYDFQPEFMEYMNHVNILCRAGASFLGLEDQITVGGKTYTYETFDWRLYKWDETADVPILERQYTLLQNLNKGVNEVRKKINSISPEMDYSGLPVTLEESLTDYNFVQFYIDPEGTSGETINNQTGDSQWKGVVDNLTGQMKEWSFLLNAGSFDTEKAQNFLSESAENIFGNVSKAIGGKGLVGQTSTFLSRLMNIFGDTIKGSNIIIPDIYQASQYTRDSLSITVHLKSPYGTKLSYYLNIFVPMMHLLALAAPRQASANSYQGPPLVKAFVEGQFSINLGIIGGFTITRVSESRSVDGLPMEVDVSMQISDLYSDLMLTSSQDPLLFINNSSLVEFLATNCALSLSQPNYNKKFDLIVNAFTNKVKDIPGTIKNSVQDWIASEIYNITHLTR